MQNLLYNRIRKSWVTDLIITIIVISGVVITINYEQIQQTFIEPYLTKDGLIIAVEALTEIAEYINFTYLIAIIIGVIFLAGIIWRIGFHLRMTEKYTTTTCEHCSNEMNRIHRKKTQHLISYLVPLRRYYCHFCKKKKLRIKPLKRKKNEWLAD